MQFQGVFSTEDRSGVLEAHCGRTRENGHKLEPKKFWQDLRNIVFVMRLVQHWNRRPEKLWLYCFFFKLCSFTSTPQGGRWNRSNSSTLPLVLRSQHLAGSMWPWAGAVYSSFSLCIWSNRSHLEWGWKLSLQLFSVGYQFSVTNSFYLQDLTPFPT